MKLGEGQWVCGCVPRSRIRRKLIRVFSHFLTHRKHQVFEHATLASSLQSGGNSVGVGGGGAKDHSLSLVSDGGLKVKHVITQRSGDTGLSDVNESALPATAHWSVQWRIYDMWCQRCM